MLTVEVEPTFRPFSDYRKDPAPRSSDIPSLGVAIGEPVWRPPEDARRRMLQLFMGPHRERDGAP